MATSAESRMRILDMIAAGKITAEEGAQLLKTLSLKKPPLPKPTKSVMPQSKGTVVFRVINAQTDEILVNLHLPVSLVSSAQKLGAKIASNLEGFNLTQILRDLESGKKGTVFRLEKDQEVIEINII